MTGLRLLAWALTFGFGFDFCTVESRKYVDPGGFRFRVRVGLGSGSGGFGFGFGWVWVLVHVRDLLKLKISQS